MHKRFFLSVEIWAGLKLCNVYWFLFMNVIIYKHLFLEATKIEPWLSVAHTVEYTFIKTSLNKLNLFTRKVTQGTWCTTLYACCSFAFVAKESTKSALTRKYKYAL